MKKYKKVENYGKSTTKDSLHSGDSIVIQEKIDGANGSFLKDAEGNLRCFSRRKELDENNTLEGFYNWVMENIDVNLLGEDKIYFGEWLTKHKVPYAKEAFKHFYLFDVYNTVAEMYEPVDQVTYWSDKLGIMTVPMFYSGEFKGLPHIEQFIGKSELGEVGEGVVVKPQSYFDKFGNQVYSKFVSSDFTEIKKPKKHKEGKTDELDNLIEGLLTERRVEKILEKLQEDEVLDKDLNVSDMGEILKHSQKMAIDDVLEEEQDRIINLAKKKIGKKYPHVVKEVIHKQVMEDE